MNSLTADGKSAIELKSTVITEEDAITQRIEKNYFFNCFTRMTKRDIHISKIILSSINREFNRNFFSHGMGWDIQKKSHPVGRDDSRNFAIPSHPMGHVFLKSVPWDRMGWDGMGLDGIVPSHTEPWCLMREIIV
jgi:hypothetical protein